jgi:hypothetical protein
MSIPLPSLAQHGTLISLPLSFARVVLSQLLGSEYSAFFYTSKAALPLVVRVRVTSRDVAYQQAIT